MSILPFLRPHRQIEEKQFHPATEIFPMLGEQEYKKLKADILKNGPQAAIILCDGLILDGRSRYQVCFEEGIEPEYEPINVQNPLAYLVSVNVNRRHLDQTQKAWIGAKICNGGVAGVQICTRYDAAQMMGVSERSVASACATQKRGIAELHTAVHTGRIAVSMAEQISQFSSEKQKEIVALDTTSQMREAIREHKRSEKRRDDNGKPTIHDVKVAFSEDEYKKITKSLAKSAHNSVWDFVRACVLASCAEETFLPNDKLFRLQTYGKSRIKRSYSDKAMIVDRTGSSQQERDEEMEYDEFLASPFSRNLEGSEALKHGFEEFKRNRVR